MNTERNQTLDLGNCILWINRASKKKSANITFIIPDEVSEKFIKAFVDAARGKKNWNKRSSAVLGRYFYKG